MAMYAQRVTLFIQKFYSGMSRLFLFCFFVSFSKRLVRGVALRVLLVRRGVGALGKRRHSAAVDRAKPAHRRSAVETRRSRSMELSRLWRPELRTTRRLSALQGFRASSAQVPFFEKR